MLLRSAAASATAAAAAATRGMGTLTHLRSAPLDGGVGPHLLPAMVDVTAKPVTARTATAEAFVRLPPAVWAALASRDAQTPMCVREWRGGWAGARC